MRRHRRVLTVVEARSFQSWLVKLETQRLDQVQLHSRVRTQPNNVAGIWRYFRFIQDQAKHADTRPARRN